MKGSLHTDELMAAVVRRERGLRTARRVSHCFVMDVPSYAETLIITDAAVNIAPTLEDKVDIVQNAIDLAHALRFPEVRVAILSAMETVNPKVPSTVEAAALCKMADRGQITGAILDGPLALDNAISLESVAIKKIDSPVAGRANVLVVPDLEAGNMLAKSLSFLAGADAAGIVLGARVPIILTSRADSVMTRLASCAVAALVASARREAGARRWPDMADAIAVLNAGSSSLKFSVFAERGAEFELHRARAGRRAVHGAAFHRQGRRRRKLLDEKSWGAGVTAWPRWRTRASGRVPARRVRRASPVRRRPPRGARRTRIRAAGPARCDDPGGARKVHPARAAAPASQPGPDQGAPRALAATPAGGLLRHGVSPRRACGGTGVRAAQGDHRPRRAPLRLSRALVRVHRRRAAAIRRARGARQDGGSPPRQRRQHVRHRRWAQRRQHDGLHRCGRTADGHALRQPRSRCDAVPAWTS